MKPHVDINNIVCKGSVGDAYMFNCILHDPSRESITIRQYISPNAKIASQDMPLIEEIYSLSPNIEVSFVDKAEWKNFVSKFYNGVERGASFRPGPIHLHKLGVGPMTPFPSFQFPETEHKVGTDYVACCPNAGQARQTSRDMGMKELDSVVDLYPKSNFVLLGSPEREGKGYTGYKKHNVTNLIGKTGLLEGMGIVARASGFIGIQGLMTYVALSQKVHSTVYTRTMGHTGAFVARMYPQWWNYCNMHFKSLSEENPAHIKHWMKRCGQ